MNKKIVVIGATSTLAELCCREWIKQENTELTLVGRNIEPLKDITHDLLVRAPHHLIQSKAIDFLNPQSIKILVDELCSIQVPDLVFIAHGVLSNQLECQDDLLACQQAIELNGISPILFAEAFARYMDKANKGIIAVIGSVAGDRGRQSNYVYGAAKALIDCYLQGLQHRFYGRSVQITIIKPGPTDTKMTSHLKNTGMQLADPQQVAKEIVQGISKRKKTIYTPKKWALIMWCIRHMPNIIFGKLRI